MSAARSERLAALLGDGRRELGAPVLLPGTGGIPKGYALARLLEHGAMTRDQLLSCTRWDAADLDECLGLLSALRLVRLLAHGFAGHQVYEAVVS